MSCFCLVKPIGTLFPVLLFATLLSSQTPQMIGLPGGSFQMGCTPEQAAAYTCNSSTLPVRTVTVYPFEIGKYEVTQSEWAALVPEYQPVSTSCSGPQKPVVLISLFDIMTYCNRLSLQNGFEPCYYFDAAFTQVFDSLMGVSVGQPFNFPVYWKMSAEGYRVPTEAEWEYAARAGQNTVYAGSDNIGQVAWYKTNSNNPPGCRDVGLKAANAWGMKDMCGNVAEKVWDWVAFYPNEAQCNPTGPAIGSISSQKALRGGAYFDFYWDVRVSARGGNHPSLRSNDGVGFRLARGALNVYCSDQLIEPQDGATDVSPCTSIRWNRTNFAVSGYRLSLGTTPGSADILSNYVVTDTFYHPPAELLPLNTTIYVKIVPFTSSQTATGCPVFSFTTNGVQPVNPLGIATPEQPSVCDFSQTLQITGDTSLTEDYFWSTGDTTPTTVANGPGFYVLTTYFQGCVDTTELFINYTPFNQYPQVDGVTVTPSITGQNSGAIDLGVSNGVPPYQFEWYFTPTAGPEVLIDTSEDLDSLPAGLYHVEITDYVGCQASQSYVVGELSATQGANESAGGYDFGILPNPNNGSFDLLIAGTAAADFRIDLFDAAGRPAGGSEQAAFSGGFMRKHLDFGALPGGFYILRLGAQGRFFWKKMWIKP